MFIEWSHAKPRSTLSIFQLHPASPAERSWLQPSYLEIKITHLTLKAKNAHSFGRSSARGVSAPTLGIRLLSLCRCLHLPALHSNSRNTLRGQIFSATIIKETTNWYGYTALLPSCPQTLRKTPTSTLSECNVPPAMRHTPTGSASTVSYVDYLYPTLPFVTIERLTNWIDV
jgi:hypothetical protein